MYATNTLGTDPNKPSNTLSLGKGFQLAIDQDKYRGESPS